MNVTLAPGTSLRRIAEIVRNAVRFGPDAWQGGPQPDTWPNPRQPQHVLPTDRDVVDLFTLLGERRVTVYEGDIASLMQRHRPAMEPLLQRLQSHPETGNLTELRGIVRDIETRIARFDQHKRA
jgi:hypothetical protein